MATIEIESRHSDYGDDAGGYRVLRFKGDWVGRVTDSAAAERLVEYVRGLEAALAAVKQIIDGQETTTPPA